MQATKEGAWREKTKRFSHILKGFPVTSLQLLINTRVALGSLSTLPHLHKIKGTRFPYHCHYWTPDVPSIEWPSPVGSNLRSVYQHSAEAFSCSEPAGKAADKPVPSFEWLITLKWSPEITPERAGGRKKKTKNSKVCYSTSCSHVPDFSSINHGCLGL